MKDSDSVKHNLAFVGWLEHTPYSIVSPMFLGYPYFCINVLPIFMTRHDSCPTKLTMENQKVSGDLKF